MLLLSTLRIIILYQLAFQKNKQAEQFVEAPNVDAKGILEPTIDIVLK